MSKVWSNPEFCLSESKRKVFFRGDVRGIRCLAVRLLAQCSVCACICVVIGMQQVENPWDVGHVPPAVRLYSILSQFGNMENLMLILLLYSQAWCVCHHFVGSGVQIDMILSGVCDV